MGFIITGALISLSFTGGETFSAEQVIDFVRAAFKAFMLALLSFSVSLILIILGTQIHSTPSCGARIASRFFKFFSFATLGSELCLYGCADTSLDFVGQYIFLNYESPAIALCPGSGTKTTRKVNKFCALVGQDLYDAAADPAMCGPPQYSANGSQWQRPYNANDPNSRICSQLDAYYYDHAIAPARAVQKEWFGWDLSATFKRPKKGTDVDDDDVNIVEENARILGEAMCGKTEGLGQSAKDTCKKNPGGVECATVLLAYNGADKCAGEKYDDVIKCNRVCGWAIPWGWQAVFINMHDGEKLVPIKMGFEPIYKKITQLQACINAWMFIRVGIWLAITIYTVSRRCYIFETEEEDDDEYDDVEGRRSTSMAMKTS